MGVREGGVDRDIDGRWGGYEAGNDSVAAVRARHEVSVANWFYWNTKRGVGATRPRSPRGADFTELVVHRTAPGASHGIEIALASGAVVRVGVGAGEREFARVLKALAGC